MGKARERQQGSRHGHGHLDYLGRSRQDPSRRGEARARTGVPSTEGLIGQREDFKGHTLLINMVWNGQD